MLNLPKVTFPQKSFHLLNISVTVPSATDCIPFYAVRWKIDPIY